MIRRKDEWMAGWGYRFSQFPLIRYRLTLLKLLMQSPLFDENLHRITGNMVGSSDFKGTRNQILHHPFNPMPNYDTTSLRR